MRRGLEHGRAGSASQPRAIARRTSIPTGRAGRSAGRGADPPGARTSSALPATCGCCRADFVRRNGQGRIVNIHPSLLPLFKGSTRIAARSRPDAHSWLHGSFRHRRDGWRADHRAGRRARAVDDDEDRLSARACSRPSTSSIRWHCAWSPKARARMEEGRDGARQRLGAGDGSVLMSPARQAKRSTSRAWHA